MHLKGSLIYYTGEGDWHSCQGITPWLLRPHFSWHNALTGAHTPIQTVRKAPGPGHYALTSLTRFTVMPYLM